MNSIMVAGSAHLDVLARARNRDDVIDRIGDVSIEVGGTACNIAINLAHAGVNVRFLSAMNESAYSKVITEYLSTMSVEPHIEYFKNLPTGAFSAHINTAGEMVSAVSSMPVERVNFEAARIVSAMEGAKAVVLDCNMSPLALNRLVTFANDKNIPVYIAAVSEEKSLRIGSISGRIKGIFINKKEYRFFCRSVLGGAQSPSDAARILQSIIVMTDGAAGATLALPDGTTAHIPPPEVSTDGSCLGMGDALAAGIVLMHEIHQFPIDEAANKALKMVSWVGSSQHCHPGKDGTLEAAIDLFQHHAGHDAMTGILNRRSTEQALSKALDRRRSNSGSHILSLLLLDIDLFKSINDTYGHNIGDEVIINVVKAAQSCLRDTDYMGRWGGEEFIIVLPDTPREAALRIADRVRVAVEQKVRSPRPVTVSVGCSETIGEMASDLRSLVELADKALYQAKRLGRNRVVCASELVERCLTMPA